MSISQIALTPFGIGTSAPTGSTPPSGAAGTRYINPATRDYEIDTATGQLKQMPTARQRVLLAVLTLQRSVSIDIQRGIKLPRKMTPTFEVEMQQSVRTALFQLTDVEKIVLLQGVDVVRGESGRSMTTIRFIDLTTGESTEVSFS